MCAPIISKETLSKAATVAFCLSCQILMDIVVEALTYSKKTQTSIAKVIYSKVSHFPTLLVISFIIRQGAL